MTIGAGKEVAMWRLYNNQVTGANAWPREHRTVFQSFSRPLHSFFALAGFNHRRLVQALERRHMTISCREPNAFARRETLLDMGMRMPTILLRTAEVTP